MVKSTEPNIRNLVINQLRRLINLGIIRAIKLISREKIKRFDRFINEIRALKTLVANI